MTLNVVGGRYALYGELAAGGMATVYFGRLLGAGGFSRTVAIKRLHPHLAKNSEFVAMFLDEARLAARIQHPNVVPTLDVVATDEDVLLVLEYVHGDSLAALHFGTRKLGPKIELPIVLSVVSGALHGLHAAHEAKNERDEPLRIVHRDVSPQNLLVGADGVTRILDFGVAKAAGRLQATREGQLKGKLSYMAPEQLHGAELDRTSDVYAAGVVLWEGLTGQRLFHAESEATVVTKVLEGDVPPPSRLTPSVSPELDAITLRALSRDRGSRFATAREMALAIEKCGPLAMPSQVGEWVQRVAGEQLKKRAATIARFERESTRRATLDAKDLVEHIGMRRRSDAPPAYNESTPSPPTPSIRPSVRPAPGLGSDPKLGVPVVSTAGLVGSQRPSPPAGPSRARAMALGGAAAIGVVAVVALGVRLGLRGGAATEGAAAAPLISCPPDMVPVAAGLVRIADQASEVHAFCIDRTEVTTQAYFRCAQASTCRAAAPKNEWPNITQLEHEVLDPLCNARSPEANAQHPINCVSFEMAAGFCKARQARLPTDAEWHLAALGSDGRKSPWGEQPAAATLLNACGKECLEWGQRNRVDEVALYPESDGYATTAPVGLFPAGKAPSGALDLFGNVWEWVDGTGARAEQRPIRGGAWNLGSLSAVRGSEHAERKSYSIGFRCAHDALGAPGTAASK